MCLSQDIIRRISITFCLRNIDKGQVIRNVHTYITNKLNTYYNMTMNFL